MSMSISDQVLCVGVIVTSACIDIFYINYLNLQPRIDILLAKSYYNAFSASMQVN